MGRDSSERRSWSAYETGTYNELVIPDVIRTLEQNGWKADADKLRAHWEKKAAFFINQKPDLFQSEYPFDSTGFESTHALAKYAVTRVSSNKERYLYFRVVFSDSAQI